MDKKDKNTFEPKCILTNRALAFTATGYLIPCCWLDDHNVWNQKWVKNFYKKKWETSKTAILPKMACLMPLLARFDVENRIRDPRFRYINLGFY